jgi:hypothetical protein
MIENQGFRLLLAFALIGYGALHWLLHHPLHPPPGVLAADEPVQVDLQDAVPFDIDGGHYHLRPLAEFHVTARVLSREDYNWDRLAAVVPTDLALGWGRMSDSAILKDIDISQGERFYYWYTHHFPIPRREIETHSANMHLIPADSSVRKAIARVREGQVIHFDGKLVELKSENGWSMRSSLTREDTGAGACELVWVEQLDLR